VPLDVGDTRVTEDGRRFKVVVVDRLLEVEREP
jgi:hypothetical protein